MTKKIILLLCIFFVTLPVLAFANTSLRFDGGDRVIIPNSPSLNPSQITVETWVRLGRIAYGGGYSGTQAQFFVCKGGDRTAGGYNLSQGGTSPSTAFFAFQIAPYSNNWYVTTPPGTLETSRWYHVAGTYDGTTLRIYVDGVLQGSKNIGSVQVGNSSPLYFSYDDVGGFPYYLNGNLQEVRIWNTARTESEIKSDMYKTLTGSESGLAAYYRLNGGTDQVVNDYTGNGNSGQFGSTAGVDGDDPTWVSDTLYDDFESYNSGTFPDVGGWDIVYSGAGSQYQYVDNTKSVSGSKSLRLTGSSDFPAGAYHPVDIQQRIRLEAKVFVNQIVSCGIQPALAAVNIRDLSSGATFGGMRFNCDGNIYAVKDNIVNILTGSLMSYKAQTWYRITLDVDLNAMTFDVYIDGILRGSGIQILNSGTPTGIFVAAGYGATNPVVWFDDLNLTYNDLNISPSRGGNAGQVTVTLRSQKLAQTFIEGTTAKLVKDTKEITGSNTTIVDSGKMTTTFDLAGVGAPVGQYNLIVTLPDNTQLICENCFTVEQGGEAKLWVEIVGPDRIRVGREQTFLLTYGNNGNIDALGLPLWIAGIPKDANVKLNFKVTEPPLLNKEKPIDWSQVPVLFETDDMKALPFFIPLVLAGNKKTLSITLAVSTSQKFNLRSWINPPSFGSPLHQPVVDCNSAIFNVILDFAGLVPGVNCVWQINSLIVDLYTQTLYLGLNTTTGNIQGENVIFSVEQMFFSALSTLGDCIADTNFFSKLILAIPKGMKLGLDMQITIDKCIESNMRTAENGMEVNVITSFDPNDKSGPAGFGEQRFVTSDHSWTYMINFENLKTASAAAQEVLITDQLDSNLDWSTFSFGDMQIGEKIISVSEGSQNFSTTVDLRPEILSLVDVNCSFDSITGKAECLFQGKDPDTNELNDFLPPNTIDVDPRGRGWISYSVKPKQDLPTGTVIKNKATIDFEVNIPPAPMETPEVFNTIDSGKPSSSVSALSSKQKSATFTVNWNGNDDTGGSGIKNYDIYVSDNGGSYTFWTTKADTSATFTGECGHRYSFYSRAHDNVGNIEDAPGNADASTTVLTCPYTLKIKRIGSGNGIVTSSDGKINGSNFSAQYAKSTIVPLTAIPDENSTFKKWIGCTRIKRDGTCTVKIGANGKKVINVKAKFTAKK